LYELLIIL